MTALSLVRETTYEWGSQTSTLSPFVWQCVQWLNKVHYAWRYLQLARIYSDERNLLHLAGGHTLSWVFGDRALIRLAAQVILISRRIIQCIEAFHALSCVCSQWSLCLNRPLRVKLLSVRLPSTTWISPSTELNFRYYLQPLLERTREVAIQVLSVAAAMCRLSMCMMDAVDAFAINPEKRNESIQHMFVHLRDTVDIMVRHEDRLLEELKGNRIMIEKVLSHSPFTYDQLEKAVEGSVKTVGRVHRIANQADRVGQVLLEAGKDAVRGFKHTIQGAWEEIRKAG